MKIILQLAILIYLFTGCTNSLQKESIKPVSSSYTEEKIVKVDVPAKKQLNKSIEVEEISIVKTDKIAIVFPSATIGKYALEATNTINTFLLYKKKKFDLTAIDMVIQNKQNIYKAFEQLSSKSITKAIVLITKEELETLYTIPNIKNIAIYLPLVNRYEVKDVAILEDLNIVFGAISYKKQFEKLIQYANTDRLSELYDNSSIGLILHNYLSDVNLTYSKKVNDNNGLYKNFIKNNKKIDNSAIILNTPIVKSSILLSAFTSEQINRSNILSTQLNFTPLLFSLTQKIDRRNVIVASSIGNIPLELSEYNELLGNNLTYSWVNYSVLVGAELLLSGDVKYFKDLSIDNKQILYPVNLYKVESNSFELIQ